MLTLEEAGLLLPTADAEAGFLLDEGADFLESAFFLGSDFFFSGLAADLFAAILALGTTAFNTALAILVFLASIFFGAVSAAGLDVDF